MRSCIQNSSTVSVSFTKKKDSFIICIILKVNIYSLRNLYINHKQNPSIFWQLVFLIYFLCSKYLLLKEHFSRDAWIAENIHAVIDWRSFQPFLLLDKRPAMGIWWGVEEGSKKIVIHLNTSFQYTVCQPRAMLLFLFIFRQLVGVFCFFFDKLFQLLLEPV